MGEKLTLSEDQIRALKMTQRGRETLIIRRGDELEQPMHISRAMAELPELVRIGLMSHERLSDDADMYRITPAGRAALASKEGEI